MTTENQKPNYFGNVFYEEYENEFTGYTLSMTATEITEALKKADANGRVKVRIRKGRDPKRPYAVLLEPKAAQSAPKSAAPQSDLPF
jgi:hypothetical protein